MIKYIVSTYLTMLAMFLAFNAFAGDLPASDRELIKNSGIPIYSKAQFINGGKDMGFRFATKEPLGNVQKWYRDQLGSWSLYDQHGGWILHDGPAGTALGQVMTRKQVQVQKNPNLVEWFGLDKSMGTEIVIMVKGF